MSSRVCSIDMGGTLSPHAVMLNQHQAAVHAVFHDRKACLGDRMEIWMARNSVVGCLVMGAVLAGCRCVSIGVIWEYMAGFICSYLKCEGIGKVEGDHMCRIWGVLVVGEFGGCVAETYVVEMVGLSKRTGCRSMNTRFLVMVAECVNKMVRVYEHVALVHVCEALVKLVPEHVK